MDMKNETKMVTEPKKTRMILKKEKEKLPDPMVLIETLRDISVDGELIPPGYQVEVPESLAKDLCKPIKTLVSHCGFMSDQNTKRYEIVRAKRVEN